MNGEQTPGQGPRLDGLDAVAWQDLEHGGGSAADVPVRLRRIAVAEGEQQCGEAFTALADTLWQQGAIFEATPPAVPFLVELLASARVPCRGAILQLLARIAGGDAYYAQRVSLFPESERQSEVFQEELETQQQWVRACRAAVWEGCDVYLRLLDDPADDIRLNLPYLMSLLLTLAGEARPERFREAHLAETISQRLAARISVEPNALVKASCACCLGTLADEHAANLQTLEQLLREAPEPAVRIAAATCLADYPGFDEAVGVLVEAVRQHETAEGLFTDDFPWIRGPLRFTLIAQLCSQDPGQAERMLPAFLAAIDAASHETIASDVAPIVEFVFRGAVLDDGTDEEDLSKPQWQVLNRIYDNPALWDPRHDEVDAAFQPIGLTNSRAQWQKLLGRDESQDLEGLDLSEAEKKELAELNELVLNHPSLGAAYNNRGWFWYRHKRRLQALADYQEALRLDPELDTTLNNRAILWGELGQYAKTLADHERVLSIRKDEVLDWNNLAWLLATCPDSRFRNAARAVENATRACEMTEWGAVHCLGTLAAAHAENRDFRRAIHYQRRALRLAPDDDKEQHRQWLALYREGKPYREPPAQGLGSGRQ